MKRALSILLVINLIVVLVSYGSGNSSIELTVDKAEISVKVGEEAQVKIKTGYGNYSIQSADETKVTATVKETTIIIKGVNVGETAVTVTDGQNKSTVIKVIVTFTDVSLADSYPNDIGIENDANVLYVEKFNNGMTNILSRYDDKLNPEGMSIDEVDVPTGSKESYSLKMTSISGGVNNGGHLFKKFSPGFNNTIYVRYYVKYPTSSNGYFHHESVWFGGHNPSTSYTFPRAGTCGLGDSRLIISYEPVWKNSQTPEGMDTYLYWGGMRSFNEGENCYGNTTINEGRAGYNSPASEEAPVVTFDEWMCIEIMIKLNDPVTAHNGELKVWQDGVPVGHWGPGFPNGYWLRDKWYNNPAGTPFEGFQWRTDVDLNINWLWFEFFHDDPNAPSSYIKFANLVVAKEYIGPINNPTDATK